MADHSLHLRNLLNTALVVSGAVVIGGAMHRSVVTGAVPVTAPVTVAMVLGGLVLIVVGHRFRIDPETVRERLGTDPEGEAQDSEYDGPTSPLEDVPEERDGNT